MALEILASKWDSWCVCYKCEPCIKNRLKGSGAYWMLAFAYKTESVIADARARDTRNGWACRDIGFGLLFLQHFGELVINV